MIFHISLTLKINKCNERKLITLHIQNKTIIVNLKCLKDLFIIIFFPIENT